MDPSIVEQTLRELEQEQQEEEVEVSFKENAPHLYDMIVIDKSLESTSHTVQWLDRREECVEDSRFTTEYFLMGTHFENDDNEGEGNSQATGMTTDSVKICSVNLPKLDKGVEFGPNETELQKRMSKIQVHTSIEHPGDVSKARAMIGDSTKVASFTNSGDINLYDFKLMKMTLALKGHGQYGFGLNWIPNLDGSPSHKLVTGSMDSTVKLWDINQAPDQEGAITALSTLTNHTKEVNGIDVLLTQPDIFASVSDDSTLALWDSRELSTPTMQIKASENGLNAVAFSYYDDN